MIIYWNLIIEPLLTLTQPRRILEIGAERGDTTRALLGFCERYGATLHSVDPSPRFDVPAWRQYFGERLVMHLSLSLEALPTIDACDAALIDGDHNWYTVYNELKLIERRSSAAGRPFPLAFLHDIGWPYGRRDLYYDPRNIPAAHRHQCAQKGILPGMSDLQANGGINGWLWNACAENTPRNGVLTGLEDFLKETTQALELVKLPGFHGLGILFPKALMDQNEPFRKFMQSLSLSPLLEQYLELAELIRINTMVQLDKCQDALKRAQTGTGERTGQKNPAPR